MSGTVPPGSLPREASDRGRSRALEARRRRAEVKAAVRDGALDLAGVLDLAETDEDVARLRVRDILAAQRGIGPVRVDRILKRCRISVDRRLSGLGPHQRAALLAEFPAHSSDVASSGRAAGPSSGPSAGAPAGCLMVLSGPSGVGKSSVVARLRERYPEVWFSVSATTREPRAGEVDGRDYHFVSDREFDRRIAAGDFLEWAEYAGHRYGTPAAPVRERLAAGVPVIVEIEIQGARQVRAVAPDALLVFLAPPDWDTLVERLRGRGTEDADRVARRLEVARSELAAEPEFDVSVVNAELDRTVARLRELIREGGRAPQPPIPGVGSGSGG